MREVFGEILEKKLIILELLPFLAHLSRRLIGELIVYKGIRRPSFRHPSVRLSTFSKDISGIFSAFLGRGPRAFCFGKF